MLFTFCHKPETMCLSQLCFWTRHFFLCYLFNNCWPNSLLRPDIIIKNYGRRSSKPIWQHPKGQLISKCLMVSSLSLKKRTNEFALSTQTAFCAAKRCWQKKRIRSFAFWENRLGTFDINWPLAICKVNFTYILKLLVTKIVL